MKKPSAAAPDPASTLTVTEAARNFSDIINRARYRRERFILTKGGRPVAEIRPLTGAGGTTAGELAIALAGVPRLGPEEAVRFERDLDEARSELGEAGGDPWE